MVESWHVIGVISYFLPEREHLAIVALNAFPIGNSSSIFCIYFLIVRIILYNEATVRRHSEKYRASERAKLLRASSDIG